MKTISAKQSANGVHRETLAFMKSEGRLEGTALALNVEQKVRQGRELNEVEAGVLNLGITKEQLRFIRKHGLQAGNRAPREVTRGTLLAG